MTIDQTELRRLAESSDPADVLRASCDGYKPVREVAALNPHAGTETRTLLAADDHAAVRSAVARNTFCEPELLRRLLADPRPVVRSAAAGHPDAPADELAALTDDDTLVRSQVLSRRTLDRTVQLAFSDVDDSAVLDKLGGRDDLHRDTAVRLLEVRGEVASLAGNPTVDADLLDRIAEAPNRFVRQRVAENPSTSPGTLDRLAADPSHHVRREVARNPNTPTETLWRLCADDDREVALTMHGRTDLPLHIMCRLVADPRSDWSRSGTVGRTGACISRWPVLGRELNGMDGRRRRAFVAGWPRTPVRVLDYLVDSDDHLVLGELADNPAAPDSVRVAAALRSSIPQGARPTVPVST